MSKELQDKAEQVMRELKDALVPLKEQMKLLRGNENINDNKYDNM